MRRIYYLLVLLAGLWGFVACDNAPTNPGDFNVKCELAVGTIVSQSTGQAYSFTIVRDFDTIFQHRYFKYDTLKNAAGEPVITGGKMTITTDTLYYPSKFTARYRCSDTIMLPSAADTFSVKIQSNSRWFAPVPDNKKIKQWFFNYNASLSGAGDGTLQFYTERNRGKRRANFADQRIFTQDTTITINLVFGQAGEKDK